MFATLNRSYHIASGYLELKVDYWRNHEDDTLNLDILEDVDLKYGYEDDDQLTFYPNRLELRCKDPIRKNYDILKISVGEFDNTLPESRMKYAGVELKLDGILKFKGYIDPLTLTFEDDSRTLSFEAIDHIVDLNNMTVDRTLMSWGENQPVRLTQIIHNIFRQAWIDFDSDVSPVENITNPALKGIFFKHDWKFRGYKTLSDWQTRDWAVLTDFLNTWFIADSMQLWGPDRPAQTWGELLRLLALQFGCTIGSMDYHRVYLVKRFLTSYSNATDITHKIINPSMYKVVHLNTLRGVKVFNYWNNEQTASYGSIELTDQGEYKYPDRVLELKTYVGSEGTVGSGGTSIFADFAMQYPVFNTVWDPAFGTIATAGHCFQIVARWYRNVRIRPKDKIECELTGTDYYLTNFYSVSIPGRISAAYRPMELIKRLTRKQTRFVGIEV